MTLSVETRTIDGLRIRTQQLPALRSFALFSRLGRILAPAFAHAAGLDLDKIGEEDVSVLAPLLTELFSNLDPKDAASLAQEILARTTVVVDNNNVELCNDGAIDEVFTGKFKTFLQTMLFSIQVNYSDFFVGAPGTDNPGASDEEKES